MIYFVGWRNFFFVDEFCSCPDFIEAFLVVGLQNSLPADEVLIDLFRLLKFEN